MHWDFAVVFLENLSSVIPGKAGIRKLYPGYRLSPGARNRYDVEPVPNPFLAKFLPALTAIIRARKTKCPQLIVPVNLPRQDKVVHHSKESEEITEIFVVSVRSAPNKSKISNQESKILNPYFPKSWSLS